MRRRDCQGARECQFFRTAAASLRLGRYQDSIRAYDQALKTRSERPSSLYARGIAKLRSGDAQAGSLDIDAARALTPRIDAIYAEYGIGP